MAVPGKVQTVLGWVEPDTLGVTMTHEHLSMNFDVSSVTPAEKDKSVATDPISMANLGWIRQNPYSHKVNLQLHEEKQAVLEEMKYYKQNGGCTIVENTTTGILRDVEFQKKVSEETGVNIIAGAGYYVGASHPPSMASLSVEDVYEQIVKEVMQGADGTDIKCGVIGEIGCSWPLTVDEKKVLEASAQAQTTTGCPVIIHPGRDPLAPFQIIRILQEAGGDASKTVMSHLDRTIFDLSQLCEFAALGPYCEYDHFGLETSAYQFLPEVDMPHDGERIRRIQHLVKEGFQDKILISHDIHTKHRLMKYGGHGYSHILLNVVPMMRLRGVQEDVISKILVDNPKKWLTFK